MLSIEDTTKHSGRKETVLKCPCYMPTCLISDVDQDPVTDDVQDHAPSRIGAQSQAHVQG